MIQFFNPLAPFRLVLSNWFLFRQMLARNILRRYHGSVLGLAWSLAQPLMMLAVYTFVFGIILKARWEIPGIAERPAAYPVILFCGLAIYQMFSDGINASGTVVIENAPLVKKVIFPLALLPLIAVCTGFAFGLAWFAPLFLSACYFLDSLSLTMLWLPLPILALFFLTAGLSFAIAAFGVYLRDIPQIVIMLTQIVFFLTPIIYPVAMVPERMQWMIWINPLTYIVEETRKIFLYRQEPDCLASFLILAGSWAIFQLGFACFSKMKKGFADVC